MNTIFAWLAAGLLAGMSAPAWADEDGHREHGAHVHGVANLDLAVDANEIMAVLTAPAMNIVGFEHAPRNDDQHRAVDQAAAWLKDGTQWLIPSAAAACRLETARVASGLLDRDDPDELRSVEIRLFEQFPGMERIQLQAITHTRQTGGVLTAGNAVINLAE